MPTAFLLRFQEACVPDDVPGISCGTRTETRNLREGGDLDPRATDYCALTKSEGEPVTATKIAKPREGPDADEFQAKLRNIHRPGATKTITYVRAETDDEDPDQAFLRVIPRSNLPVRAGTKTFTAIKAETDDNDHCQANLRAIHRCS
jgi:hypothetical protein